MSRLVVGPFNRVEGDLEVTLDISGGRVDRAYVDSTLYRGFEQILRGKDPMDALVFVPRICGICSVTQSVAAANALRNAMGISIPRNGQLATNLILANENLTDHFTHFYLFFMPDFARDGYSGRPWHGMAEQRFKAVTGSAAGDALPARAAFLHMMGVLAGKWPHTLTLQPGGSSRAVSSTEKIRLYAMLREFRAYLEKIMFGDKLENIVKLDSMRALEAWRDARPPDASDFRLFLEVARDLELHRIGRATDIFLSYGSYEMAGEYLFSPGVWDASKGTLSAIDPSDIVEDLSHSRMTGERDARHPYQGETQPAPDKPDAYTWCKAPRWRGQVLECGALARQVVTGHPLIRDMVEKTGGNVTTRVVARLLEISRVIPAMESWIKSLSPGEPFCVQGRMPDNAKGVGMVEAARGALGHWLVVKEGKIANYQIVAPTTWNFSPRDRDGIPGALEQALVGVPVGEHERVPLAVQHVVRSFDPCMVCTVH
ncbi:HupV protein [Sulfuriferula plumbiphila]|uniref:HupV protein n=1 Tax=Sulfuriferula plumbiphila TaxID=171865 RepID=A0A512LBA0_9PROT|nr:nickel-dependent hydrogenase large subunit [Sulfuriferula plumbiphila]BBP04456.1 HupV protein [Sulfuriferula plumbiphila]GEP31758.1 HupV protein [Sulfuriferula plumbiphila]